MLFEKVSNFLLQGLKCFAGGRLTSPNKRTENPKQKKINKLVVMKLERVKTKYFLKKKKYNEFDEIDRIMVLLYI